MVLIPRFGYLILTLSPDASLKAISLIIVVTALVMIAFYLYVWATVHLQ